tara:strand:- start:1559 stop:2254 length:696 start_codon:yes stop_codon:yes gene_type:complete
MDFLNILNAEMSAIILTLKLSLVTCIFLFFIGTPISLYLAFKKNKFIPIFESIVTLPLVLPPTVIGFYLLVFFNPESILGKFFITITGEQLAFSFSGLVFASIFYSLPFWVQPLQNSFEKIDKKILEAGTNMGGSNIDLFLKIILPSCKRGFLTAFILSFAHTIGEFGIVLMVGGNIQNKTRVLSISIYDHVEQLSYQNAHFLSIFLILFSFLILLLLYYLNKKSSIGLKQ